MVGWRVVALHVRAEWRVMAPLHATHRIDAITTNLAAATMEGEAQ